MSTTTNGAIVVASNLSEIESLAKKIAGSSLVPQAYKGKPDDCYVAMLMGNELGLAPIQSLNNFDVVDGRPQARARLKQALAQRHPECEYFQLVESSDTKATYETKRRSHPHPTRLSYTIEQATKAGLARKSNWMNHTAAMLRARCSGALADAVYPEATLGLPPDDYAEEAPSRLEETKKATVEAVDISEASPPAKAPEPSRAEEVKAAIAAKKAEQDVQDVELKEEKAPTPPAQVTQFEKPPAPTPPKKAANIVGEDGKPIDRKAAATPAAADDWWAKAQLLAKLRGVSAVDLKAKLKSLGAAGPKSVTQAVYEQLEAAYPAAGKSVTQAVYEQLEAQSKGEREGDLF